jgi:hypothetical protein
VYITPASGGEESHLYKTQVIKDHHDLRPSAPTLTVVSRERIAASPCTWLSHAPSTIPDKTPHRHPAGFPFHSTPAPAWSDVPHVRLGSSLAPCPGFPWRASIAVDPTTLHPYGRNRWDLPSSSTYLLPLMPRPEDSGGPPHPRHYGCFVWTSGSLRPSSSATSLSRSCASPKGERGFPYGLQDSLSTLRLSCSPLPRLHHRRKTRYGRVASPYPTGTRRVEPQCGIHRRGE